MKCSTLPPLVTIQSRVLFTDVLLNKTFDIIELNKRTKHEINLSRHSITQNSVTHDDKLIIHRRIPHCVVANVLDCNIRVSKFKLLSCNYIHFWTNTLGEKI